MFDLLHSLGVPAGIVNLVPPVATAENVAKMRNGDSSCTAANCFEVHAELYGEFVKAMAARLREMLVGSGLHRINDVGALVSVGERDKAELVVGRGRRGGLK